MPNTIDVDLLVDSVSKQVKTTLGNRLAPLSAFARNFTADVLTQTKNVQIMVVTGAPATQTNPTTFGGGDSTTDNVAVPVNHYSQPFHLSTVEVNQGFQIEQLIAKAAQTLGDTLMDAAMTPITAGNFTQASGVIAQTAIAADDLQAAWAAVAKSPVRNILLDAVAYSKFLPTNLQSFRPEAGAYGFDGFFLNTRWNGAVAGTYGFACGPDAICMGAGIPMIHPAVQQQLYSSTIITLEGIGLSVQLNLWGSLGTRRIEGSLDLFFGAAFGKDTAAGYRIRSA